MMKDDKRNRAEKRPVSGNILNKERYRKRKRRKNAAAVFIESGIRSLKDFISGSSSKKPGSGRKPNNGRDEIVRVIRDENGVPVKVIRKRHIPVPKQTRRKQVIGLVASLVLVWLLFFQIRYEPLMVTEVGGQKLRGKLEKEIEMTGVEDRFLETGKDYKIDITEKYTDIFGRKASVKVSSNDVKISANDSSQSSLITTDKEKFRISNSVTSQTEFDINVQYEDMSKTYKYVIKDRLKNKIDKNGNITNPNEYDAVVNKKRHVKSSYKPKDLVEPKVRFAQSTKSVRPMRKESAKALEELFSAAEKKGHTLYAISGFRTYEMQKRIHDNNIAQYGSDETAEYYSAKAGESEHQLGTTMDVSTKQMGYALNQSFGKTSTGKWLKKNCHKYGFIIRYPKGKENITGYSYEPWHLRYVGKTLAGHLYKKRMTLEEYFEK